jgi:hypothetical protein
MKIIKRFFRRKDGKLMRVEEKVIITAEEKLLIAVMTFILRDEL